MKVSSVPRQKIGTVFQRPSWRYDAARNPDRYGFRSLCSRQKASAGCYKRLITKGAQFQVTYKIPAFFKSLCDELPIELRDQLLKVWHRKYRKDFRGHKISFHSIDSIESFISWNLKKVDKVNDEWLRKTIHHIFNKNFSEEIQYAINLHLSKELSETKRFMGYDMFAGLTDEQMAKKWRISKKKIEAIRMLFYDFSHFPPDPVARWALLRQLIENKDITESDFALYKRVFDMGSLGVKAQLCYNHLTDTERGDVSDFLTKSAVENAFNLQFSIRGSKDAMLYNKAITDLAKLQLQKEEIKNRQAELRLMELQISKLKKEVNVDSDSTQPEDLKLLQEHISQLSYKDGSPNFMSVIDLHQTK